MLTELSLFSGYCGFTLGLRLAGIKIRTVGYVDNEEFIQRLIAQRIKDGFLDEAPIFGDIRAFLAEGYAASYQGMVDVLTAGFPCQPHSIAGRRLGTTDPRNLWPELAECIGKIGPRFVLLENVPGIMWGSQSNGRLHSWDDRRRRDNQYLERIIWGWENLLHRCSDWNEREGQACPGSSSASVRRDLEAISGKNICMGCWLDFIVIWAGGKGFIDKGSSPIAVETRASNLSIASLLLSGDITEADGKAQAVDAGSKVLCGCSCHNNERAEQKRISGDRRDDEEPPTYELRESMGHGATRSLGYASIIHWSLARIGYDARWGLVPAAAVGAPHLRWRWWCLAYPANNRCNAEWRTAKQGGKHEALGRGEQPGTNGRTGLVADAKRIGGERRRTTGDMVGASGTRQEDSQKRKRNGYATSDSGEVVPDGQGEQMGPAGQPREHGGLGNANWWDVEPPLGGSLDGTTYRVVRLATA